MDFPLVSFQGGDLTQRGLRSSSHLTRSDAPFLVEDADATSLLNHSLQQLEEHSVLTSLGIHQRVYVLRSKSKRALLTYHDIGTNHTSFLGFFNHPQMRVLTRHFTVYHVCAPGHHEHASNEIYDEPATDQWSESLLPDSKQVTSTDKTHLDVPLAVGARRSSAASESGPHYPTLDQLAQMLTSILGHFGIDCFIGFGMGAGSNVLARYALHFPDNVLGLFLLNPTATTHPYYQKFRCRWWDLPQLQQGVLTDNMLEQLNTHWFGYGLDENADVVRFYHQLASSLNPVNLAGYIQSFMERTPLNLVRPIGPCVPSENQAQRNQPETTVITTDVCLVTGDRATDLCRALADMNGKMDPKRTQYLMIPDCTGMVMEESPEKLAVDFLHFLRSIGLLISLTPEKMHQQAVLLQQAEQERSAQEHSVGGLTPARLNVESEVY
ncbi:unnamed protein product [Dicrocoelium dendriticum]|nr:unnamed protein product [Dicrocoelium dendriticum]